MKQNIKVCVLFTTICFTFLGCAVEPPKEVVISADTQEVYCGQEAVLSTALFGQGKTFGTTENDFQYQASKGTLANGVYKAPMTPGEDTIEITHVPSKVKKLFKIKVIDAPKIVVDEVDLISCNDSHELKPQVFVGGKAKQLSSSDFQYKAQRGTFQGNRYMAPAFEAKDTIVISYEPLKLQRGVQFNIVAKPVLTAVLPQERITANKTMTIVPYFSKAGNRVEIPTHELSFSAVHGKFQSNTYYAPGKACNETITIRHSATQQQKTLSLLVEEDLQMMVKLPQTEILCGLTMAVTPQLQKGGSALAFSAADYNFSAKNGKFTDNIYKAPDKSKQGQDTITVTHKKSGMQQQLQVNVKYSKYVPVGTDRFVMQIPSEWEVKATDMGLIANSSKGELKWQGGEGGEIKAVALPGFDFWDLKTIMILLQQQGGVGKHMERIGPDEKINIAGQEATRVIFENAASRENRRSWWIGFKREGAVYLFIISGPPSFFESNSEGASIPENLVSTFEFTERVQEDTPSLEIPDKQQVIEHPFFNINVPETWKYEQLLDMLFASSKVYTKGEKVALMILSYRSREIQSMDPSLILLLVRQETVKDPTMKVTEEREVDIASIKGQMLEFEGGQEVKQKMWIIAAKHNFTGYAIIIKGPDAIWEANPDFANQILQSFAPK